MRQRVDGGLRCVIRRPRTPAPRRRFPVRRLRDRRRG
jgi:hypothetical protein